MFKPNFNHLSAPVNSRIEARGRRQDYIDYIYVKKYVQSNHKSCISMCMPPCSVITALIGSDPAVLNIQSCHTVPS